MMRRSLFIHLSLLVCLARLGAQELDESNFVRYTRLQGLSNNYVSGIAQDPSGYIWVATHKGLNRFDGEKFQAIFKSSFHSPLPDNLLIGLHPQDPNEIMGVTQAGAFAFDPACGGYRQFIVPCDSLIFFWTNHAMDIVKDHRGNYIVSTKTGLYIFGADGNLKRRYDHHQAADVGRQELVFGGWLQCLSDGTTLQQNDDGPLGTLYDPANNSIDTAFVAKKAWLKKLITDSSGEERASLAGRNGALLILNEERNTIDVADLRTSQSCSNPMPFPVRSELGWYSRADYINDSLLGLTCKTGGFYLLHYNHRTGKLTCDGKKYFKGNICTAIFNDREGRLWVATSDGIYKQNLRNSLFSMIDLSTRPPYSVDQAIRTIYAQGDELFLGLWNKGGILVLNRRTGNMIRQIKFVPLSEYSSAIINIFPYDKDTLWIGTSQGILWLCIKNYHYGRVQMPPELAWTNETNTLCFLRDSRNNIWISFGSLNRLSVYNPSTRTFTDLSPPVNPLLKITFVFSMAEDLQGNVWLAGDGFCRWNVKKNRVDTLIPYPRVSHLLRNYVYIMDRDDKNNLWLSSYDNEIIQYNCSTHSMYLRQQENNSLDGNTITSSPVINDKIWLGTDNGISAFSTKDYSVKQFTYADGLPSVAITTVKKSSYYDRASGRFYMGAGHRVISFIPDVSLAQKTAPSLFIEKISVHDSVIVPTAKDIRLKYCENNVTILFNTINFTDPEENRFAWRLLNSNDTNWNVLNEQTSVTLTNLSGGLHAVEIKLFSMNNHWPQQVKTVRIFIRPPFWRTGWFISLLVLLLAGAIYLIYKKRIDAVRRKEGERAQVQQLIAEEYRNRLELEQIINYFSFSLKGKITTDEIVWDVAQNLMSRMGYTDCIIYLWNADRSKMIQRAAYGLKGSPEAIARRVFDVETGQGLVGWVMQTQEPVLVPDTRKDSRYRVDDVCRLSEISVPIIHNNELIGVIDSEHPEANYYQERDMKILTTIASLVGNKIKQTESEQTLKVKQDEIATINEHLAEAQLLALQTQMNPHFIFNSLNSIKGMILENQQQRASRYLSKFAHMIRLTLNQSKEIFASLHENKEYLESYLEMEELRFDNSFTFKITIDENIEEEETLIPTLMIQPLVENAIWHGLLNLEGEKKLSIRFCQEGSCITCIIEDNGIGIRQSELARRSSKTRHQSVGLENIRKRIKVMNEKYDTHCELTITDFSDVEKGRRGTQVILGFNNITHNSYLRNKS